MAKRCSVFIFPRLGNERKRDASLRPAALGSVGQRQRWTANTNGVETEGPENPTVSFDHVFQKFF